MQEQSAAARKRLRDGAHAFVAECGAFRDACGLEALERRKTAVAKSLAECTAKRESVTSQQQELAAEQQVRLNAVNPELGRWHSPDLMSLCKCEH